MISLVYFLFLLYVIKNLFNIIDELLFVISMIIIDRYSITNGVLYAMLVGSKRVINGITEIVFLW